MKHAFFYTFFKIKNIAPVSVRALVPAYLDLLEHFFCVFPDINGVFFHKKNTLIASSY
jgi:hypothetical protein